MSPVASGAALARGADRVRRTGAEAGVGVTAMTRPVTRTALWGRQRNVTIKPGSSSDVLFDSSFDGLKIPLGLTATIL